MSLYWYSCDGSQEGPFYEATIAEKVKANPGAKHLAAVEGSTSWLDVLAVPEIAVLVTPASASAVEPPSVVPPVPSTPSAGDNSATTAIYEQALKAARKKKRRKIYFGVGALILIVIIGGLMQTNPYDKAVKLMKEKKYAEASKLLKEVKSSDKDYARCQVAALIADAGVLYLANKPDDAYSLLKTSKGGAFTVSISNDDPLFEHASSLTMAILGKRGITNINQFLRMDMPEALDVDKAQSSYDEVMTSGGGTQGLKIPLEYIALDKLQPTPEFLSELAAIKSEMGNLKPKLDEKIQKVKELEKVIANAASAYIRSQLLGTWKLVAHMDIPALMEPTDGNFYWIITEGNIRLVGDVKGQYCSNNVSYTWISDNSILIGSNIHKFTFEDNALFIMDSKGWKWKFVRE